MRVLRGKGEWAITHERGTPQTMEEFSGLWEALNRLPQPESMPAGLQVLVGVFSARRLTREAAVREVFLRSWMRRPGVCWLRQGQRPGCGVYVAFVLGQERTRSGGADDQELVLQVAEGVDGGKSYEFFRAAPRLFPWLTHVAKSDLDTFVWPSGLLWGLQHWRRSEAWGCYEFGGKALRPGRRKDPSKSPERCKQQDGFGNVLNSSFLDEECKLMFQGGFYLMDSGLALALTAPEAPWSLGDKTGPEDIVTSRYVKELVRRSGGCLSTWSIKSGFHHFQRIRVIKDGKRRPRP